MVYNKHIYPFYDDDSDYNTNAPSFYDYLAKNRHLLKELVEKVWEYDKEMAKRFAEWDKNLEELPENLERMLQEWMQDGTLAEIINETIFGWKLDTEVFNEFKLAYDDKITDLDNMLNNVFVNVKSFGAVGDGVTDDTEALQAALNYAYENGGGTVYAPERYATYKPLYIQFGVSLVGDSATNSRIIKQNNHKLTNNLTYNDPNIGMINYNDYDAIIIGVGRLGEFRIENIRLDGYSGNDNELMNDYGILIHNSYRVNFKNVLIRYAKAGIKMPIAWNIVFETVRVQFTGIAFDIGDWSITGTSITFINTFSDYNEVTYKLTNITYFSGSTMSSDFSTEVAYWFDTCFGSIDGVGMEYPEGQMIRSHRSNISMSGVYAIGIKNNTGNVPNAKTKGKIEVTSENRTGTGLTIDSADLRNVTGTGDAVSYCVKDGSYLMLRNVRDSLFRNSLNAQEIETSSTLSRDARDAFIINSSRSEINGNVTINNFDLGNKIIGYTSKSWLLPDKFVWTEMTGKNKTVLNIPLEDIKKRFPNFAHTDGFLTAPYKISIYIDGGAYIDGLVLLGRNVVLTNMYNINTTNTVTTAVVKEENLEINLTENARYVKVFITEG